MPVGQPPDPLGGLRVDPVVREVHEPLAALLDDPDRRIARVRQRRRGLADPVQRRVQLQLRPDRPHRIQEARYVRTTVRVGRGGSLGSH